MKRIFLFLMCMILLVGTISAFDFDNVKDYNPTTKEVTITNAFGLGDTIAKAKLLTPQINYVIRGQNRRVMEFEIENLGEGYSNALKKLEILNMKNSRMEQKNFHYEYAIYKEVDVNDYETECNINKDGIEVCESIVTGTHKENKITSWEKLDSLDIPKGKIRIAIVTDVNPGDHYDGIPTLFGVKVEEWAEWTESLNVGLDCKECGYFKLDEGGLGIVENSVVGGANGSNHKATPGVAGKIGTAYSFTTDDYTNTTTVGNFSGYPYTINMWVYFDSYVNSMGVWGGGFAAGTGCKAIYPQPAANDRKITLGKRGAAEYISDAIVGLGAFHMLTISQNATHINFWVNGTFINAVASTATYSCPFDHNFGFGSGAYYEGDIDEAGFWNRTLSDAEVTQLYNGGTGITYTDTFNTAPTVTLNSPANLNYTTSPTTINFNCSAEDNTQVDNVTLWIDGEMNFTQADGVDNFTELYHGITFTEGDYNWTCTARDNQSLQGTTDTRYFTIDATAPNLNITYPPSSIADGFVTSSSKLVDLNWTISDTHLGSCWYYNNSAATNVSVTCGENATLLVDYGTYTHYVYANDTLGNVGSDFQTTTYSYILLQNSESYNTSTTENTIENFVINVSYNTSIYTLSTASLHYNGTKYSSTSTPSGTNTLFSKSLIIPPTNISKNVTFLWEFSLTNASGTSKFNSTANYQYINTINASLLNDPYPVNYINFTTYDQDTLNQLQATFAMTLDYGISSFIKTLSFENTTVGGSSWSFGFSPNTTTFLVKGDLEFAATKYVTNLYTLPSQYLTSTTTNINIYLLNSTKSTSFVVLVRDNSYTSVVGAVVHIQRYYPGTDTWTTTEILTTNADGKGIGHFVAEDVNYRFLVYVDDVLELTSTPTKVFCEASPCTITLTLPEDVVFNQFENVSNLDYSLTYTKATYTFTYSYVDSDSTAAGGRLLVNRVNYGNATITEICDETNSGGTAVLTCDISTGTNGTYYAYAYNVRTGGTNLVGSLIIQKTRDIVSSVGIDGLIWTAFLIMGIVMVGLFNPAIAIVLTIASVIFVSILGLASIPAISLSAIIIIGVILLWGMKR